MDCRLYANIIIYMYTISLLIQPTVVKMQVTRVVDLVNVLITVLALTL